MILDVSPFLPLDTYAPRIERMMKRLYDSLAEDDRRRYAAIESTKLGHGGVEYISSVLQCDPKTIRRGLAELEETADLDTSRVRKKLGWQTRLDGGRFPNICAYFRSQ